MIHRRERSCFMSKDYDPDEMSEDGIVSRRLLNYIAYWNEEYTKLSDMIKQLPPESVSVQAKELKKISRIKDEVGSFLHIVSDRNIPAEDVYTQINLRLEQYTVVDKESSTKTVRLGSDAIALLISTCNASGMMCISSTLESDSISIANTNFVDCSSLDNRTIASIGK